MYEEEDGEDEGEYDVMLDALVREPGSRWAAGERRPARTS